LKQNKYWQGEIDNCDICKEPIGSTFVDGATILGPWANMCFPKCFGKYGRGIGQGVGQKYQKDSEGKYRKVAG
jgi:hypothetical protein